MMNFNSIKIYFFLLFTATIITSCGDEFLDRVPDDQISVDAFYKTEADMESAMLAVYTAIQSQQFYGEAWRIDEIPSDDSRENQPSQLDNFSVTAGSPNVFSYWQGHFRAITLANLVIERAPDADITPEKKAALIGEGKFLRAISYFNLVRIYGGVPLIERVPSLGQDLLPARASVEETYDFIKADLEEAASTLPVEPREGRATSGSAKTYLAMVHLTLREYEQARDYAKDVINSGVYQLVPDYGDLWVHPLSDNNSESVFEIQYAGCEAWGTGNQRQAFFAPWNEGITKTTDGWGSMIPTDPAIDQPGTTAVDVWEEGDIRRYWSMMEGGNFYPVINPEDGGYTYPEDGAGGGSSNVKKYVMGGGTDVCFMSTPMNASLMRYSDVLLIYAEAIVELSNGLSLNAEALGYVNQLRARAQVSELEFLDREAIELERRREFMFEGKRWFDILRKGKAKAVETMRLAGRTLNEDKLLFPIPANEIEINTNLAQNPGY